MTAAADGPTFSGAILTGGASRRMGRDKATQVLVDGAPLAQHVARALREAGAAEVLTIGGDAEALSSLGLDARPDRFPGEGPLGGVLTGLGEAGESLVVVVACDLVDLDAATVRALVSAAGTPGADAAVARAGRIEPLCAAWWADTCRGPLEAAFAAGERAVHRALDGLTVRVVAVRAGAVRNVNTQDDLVDG